MIHTCIAHMMMRQFCCSCSKHVRAALWQQTTNMSCPGPATPALPAVCRYRSGRCPARRYMQELLPLVQGGELPFTDIITHRHASVMHTTTLCTGWSLGSMQTLTP